MVAKSYQTEVTFDFLAMTSPSCVCMCLSVCVCVRVPAAFCGSINHKRLINYAHIAPTGAENVSLYAPV